MPTADASAPSIALRPLQTAAEGVRGLLHGLAQALEARFEIEREQLPLWLPVGLGLGIAAWFALGSPSAWWAFLLGAAGAALALLGFGGSRSRAARALGIFALAAALGCGLVWIKAERAAAPRLEKARLATFEARVETVQHLAAKEAVRLVIVPVPGSGIPRLRLNVPEEAAPSGLEPGALIRAKAWLMPPPAMAVPGAYDFARVAWFQQIGGTGRALGKVQILAAPDGASWRSRLAGARQRLAAHIQQRLAGAEGGIATALATGDQGAIPEEDAEAMRRSGLAHLLSVSGLHLTAAVGAVMLLTLRLLALSPALALRLPLVVIAAGAGAVAGIAYTLLTGAEVPTVRACVAALLVLLGLAIGREALTLRLLAAGALVVLLLWPESLAGPSFQLSFAAIAAIVALHEHPRIQALLSRRDEGWPRRSGRFLLGLVLTGLAVEIALAPIALYHFHKAGLYGAAANIVAIPLTTFVVMPLEALALLLDLAGIGAPFWWLCGQSLALLLGLARATAAAPGAVAMLPTMSAPAFGLMVGGGLWICLWKSRWRRWGVIPVALGAVIAFRTPAPDLIVTGDGRHMALRASSGEIAILRERSGDYVRSMLAETSGIDTELPPLGAQPYSACTPHLCVADIVRNDRAWRVMATRSRQFLDIGAFVRACAEADIVVSDRRLPRTCRPRWLKVDRMLLARTGGLAIALGETPRITTVAERVGQHPWAARAPLSRPSPPPARSRSGP